MRVMAAVYSRLPDDESGRLFADVQNQYGLPDCFFEPYVLWNKGKNDLVMCARSALSGEEWDVQARGIPFMGVDGKYPKIATALAMMMGPHVSRNVVDVPFAMRELVYSRSYFDIDPSMRSKCEVGRYVVLRVDGVAVGTGYLGASGRVKSLIPKIRCTVPPEN